MHFNFLQKSTQIPYNLVSFRRISYVQTEIKDLFLLWEEFKDLVRSGKNPQAFSLLYVCFVGDYIKMSFFQNFYLSVIIFLLLTLLYINTVLNIQCIIVNTALLRRPGPHSCFHPALLAGEEPQVPKCCWVKQLSFFVFSKIPIGVNLFEGG